MRGIGTKTAPVWIRRLIIAVVDGASWAVALTVAGWLRHEFDFARIDVPGLPRTILVALTAVWLVGAGTHMYFGRYPIGTVDEALSLTRATALVGAAVFGFTVLGFAPSIPRSVPLIAALFALAISIAARLVVREYRERKARPDRASAQRVIVYGAGARGQALVRSMLSGNAGDFLPVALLDDDPVLRHTRVSGIAVRGTGRDLTTVAGRTGAQLLIVAIACPSPATMRGVLAATKETGLEVKVLPPVSELLRPWVRFSDLRDLDVADLLGRKPINTDVASIAGYLTGKRVLVTGAGGSIGSELCRQIHRFEPADLVMLDRDESALHAVQLSIYGRAELDSPNVVLADIRDAETIRALLAERRPHVVFHAAALKHLPMLEKYPEEAWKTNVLGTMDVLDAARAADVRQFINISTDKAANPSSVLGRSKRIGERLVADAALKTTGTFLSVRFGNVLGSRGSVLSTFSEQLSAGLPLTVTHPDVTRYFMTIPEAVQLVVQAAAIGRSGEALVLDMGRPERIVELAETLMTVSGRRSKVIFTGLCKGEKLHEDLFGDGEGDHRPVHPAISHVTVPALDPRTASERGVRLGAAAAMIDLVDETVVTSVPDPRISPTSRPRQGHVRRRVLMVYGTRPEAVKMAPLFAELRRSNQMDVVVAVTGQHREMLDQVNNLFGIVPQHDLNIIRPHQSLTEITTRSLTGLSAVIEREQPDAVIVQGDTTSAFAGAVAGFYAHRDVVHLEAGLRTSDRHSPFPEEVNRRLTARVATLHLAPTPGARLNLLAEGVPAEDVVVTGNTVIDALLQAVAQRVRYTDPALSALTQGRRVVLVTAHRRESWGEPMAQIGRAIGRLAANEPDVVFVVPTHRNPVVRDSLLPPLRDLGNVLVCEPLTYGEFARLLSESHLVLTDSGGIQEEAPSLGKPVLVLRDISERPEALQLGVARLVGVCEAAIVEAVTELLHDEDAYAAMAQPANPYGDGLAAYRAARAVEAMLGCGARAEDFAPKIEVPLPPAARGDLGLGRAPEGART